MNRISFIKLHQPQNDMTNKFIYLRRDEIDFIAHNEVNVTGRRGNSCVKCKGTHYYVTETPEEVLLLINNNRFGQQQIPG